MNGLERRISKIEEVLGIKEDLSFHGFLREFFSLISGRSRGLPSEDKEEDPGIRSSLTTRFSQSMQIKLRKKAVGVFIKSYRISTAPCLMMGEADTEGTL